MTARASLKSFAAGNPGSGETEARNTLSTLNKTAHFLSMLMKTASGDGTGMPGDLMNQLQQIASGELSLQMKMNPGVSEELLARLAAEQQKLAEKLSEIGRRIADDRRLQEILDKLVEDMDNTAGMMRMNEKRELIERKQLDIYRRLLDARRSRREKDEDNERKSFTAKRNYSIGADELASDRGEKQRELNERIKEAMKDDFNPEFMRLIRHYFESMLQDNVEVKAR
jgi:DNA primase